MWLSIKPRVTRELPHTGNKGLSGQSCYEGSHSVQVFHCLQVRYLRDSVGVFPATSSGFVACRLGTGEKILCLLESTTCVVSLAMRWPVGTLLGQQTDFPLERCSLLCKFIWKTWAWVKCKEPEKEAEALYCCVRGEIWYPSEREEGNGASLLISRSGYLG